MVGTCSCVPSRNLNPLDPVVDNTGMGRWDISWLKENRPLLIAQIIGTPLAIAWLLYFYFRTHSAFALILIALLPVFAVLNVLLINRARGRQGDPTTRRDIPTGAPLASPATMPYRPGAPSTQWVGAADIPGSLGRMNASTPLAVLELVDRTLTLRIRPQFLGRLFGAKTLQVEPTGVEAVFPARGRLRSRAVCIRPIGQPPFYFFLGDRQSILTTIAAAGFPVSWEERAYSQS